MRCSRQEQSTAAQEAQAAFASRAAALVQAASGQPQPRSEPGLAATWRLVRRSNHAATGCAAAGWPVQCAAQGWAAGIADPAAPGAIAASTGAPRWDTGA